MARMGYSVITVPDCLSKREVHELISNGASKVCITRDGERVGSYLVKLRLLKNLHPGIWLKADSDMASVWRVIHRMIAFKLYM